MPEIADLLAGPSGRGAPEPRARLLAGLDATCFDHPWADPALPPLVCEDEEGRVEGFLGVVPRPMLLDRRVRTGPGGQQDPAAAVRPLETLLRMP